MIGYERESCLLHAEFFKEKACKLLRESVCCMQGSEESVYVVDVVFFTCCIAKLKRQPAVTGSDTHCSHLLHHGHFNHRVDRIDLLPGLLLPNLFLHATSSSRRVAVCPLKKA